MMSAWVKIGVAVTLAAGTTTALAQPAPRSDDPVSIPQEVRINLSKAIADVYAAISGPAGKPRDWARLRSLFTPDARLYSITPSGLRGGTVDDFIRTSGPLITSSGFTEREIGRKQQVYGNLAHVWSSYEGISADGKIRVRGINSFQLVRQADGSWKVFTILWQQENKDIPLPDDMIVEVR
jgi:hypothetical protein